MIQYNNVNVKLSHPQLNKLKSAAKNEARVIQSQQMCSKGCVVICELHHNYLFFHFD